MRRIIFHILNALSILLLLTSAVLCIYSIFRGTKVVREAVYTTGVYDDTALSLSMAGVAEGWSLVALLEVDSVDGPDNEVSWEVSELRMKDIRSLERHLAITATKFPGFILYRGGMGRPAGLNGWLITIHFGWLIPIFSILPTYWLFTRHREPRRRAALGLCVACGYDLRGSESGACPECGSQAAPHK
ncbi:MAG: hypothetical protein WD768_00370 [Phycisphaeraceae bacterium]